MYIDTGKEPPFKYKLDVSDLKFKKGRGLIANEGAWTGSVSVLLENKENYKEVDIYYHVSDVDDNDRDKVLYVKDVVGDLIEIRNKNFYYKTKDCGSVECGGIVQDNIKVYTCVETWIESNLNLKYKSLRRKPYKELINLWNGLWQSTSTEYEVLLTYKDKVKKGEELIDGGVVGFIARQEGARNYQDLMDMCHKRTIFNLQAMNILQGLLRSKIANYIDNNDLSPEEFKKMDNLYDKYVGNPFNKLDVWGIPAASLTVKGVISV